MGSSPIPRIVNAGSYAPAFLFPIFGLEATFGGPHLKTKMRSVQVPSPACRVSGPVVRKYEGSTLCLHRESAMVQRTFPKHKAAEQLAFIPRCFRGMTSLCPGLEATFGGPHFLFRRIFIRKPKALRRSSWLLRDLPSWPSRRLFPDCCRCNT